MPLFNQPSGQSQQRPRIPVKLIIGVLIAVFALVKYWSSSSTNPITGQAQHINLTREQEIQLGLNSAPQMAQQFGGLSSDSKARALVSAIGQKIVQSLPPEARNPPTASGEPLYPFDYHLLADSKTVNAFALPGGQIFITEALLSRLETPGQLAGVLGHETAHVLGRHSAQQMSKSELLQGLVGAATVASSDSYQGAQTAQQIGAMLANFVQLKYGRGDEYEADRLGLRFMANAGFDPRSMVKVMEILEKASNESGGSRQPEFSSTHPNPGNRIEHIKAWLQEDFPQGIPDDLRPRNVKISSYKNMNVTNP